MSTSADPVAPDQPVTPADLCLTWTVTDTYTGQLPLHEVAAAAGRSEEELTANPSALHGAASDALAGLLTAEYQNDDLLIGEPEVEITAVDVADTPTLRDLVDAAWDALQAESDADQPTDAGRALTALLAGLRREDVIDR